MKLNTAGGAEDDAGFTLSAAAYSAFAPWQRRAILTLVTVIGLISPMASTLYVPAMPTIARDLGITIDQINMTVMSYTIMQGVSPALWSPIADSVGRRPLFIATMIIYAFSSLALALSENFTVIMALRGLQAMGAAPAPAMAFGVISDLIHASDRAIIIGSYSTLTNLGAAIAPVVGGFLTQYMGWRSIFWFMFGIGAGTLLAIFLLMPETMRKVVDDGRFRSASRFGQPPITWLDAPKTSRRPAAARLKHSRQVDLLSPIRLFHEPELWCCLAFPSVCFGVWHMAFVALPSVYTNKYGLNSFDIGLTYIASGLGAMISSPITGIALNLAYRSQLKREQRRLWTGKSYKAIGATQTSDCLNVARARIRPVILPAVGFIALFASLGWIIEYRVHIAWPILLCFILSAFQSAVLAAVTVLVIDIFHDRTFGATACMNLVRCFLAAAGASVVSPMLRTVGSGWTFTFAAIAAFLFFPALLLELHWGEEWHRIRMARQENGPGC